MINSFLVSLSLGHGKKDDIHIGGGNDDSVDTTDCRTDECDKQRIEDKGRTIFPIG